jgi:hypothetical protein
LKYINKFNEGLNDDYWPLYTEIKDNLVLCFAEMMDEGIYCKPNAVNLFTIEVRIFKMFESYVSFSWDIVKDTISTFLKISEKSILNSKCTLDKINIRIVRNSKTDLKFESNELEDIKCTDPPAFIEITFKLKREEYKPPKSWEL